MEQVRIETSERVAIEWFGSRFFGRIDGLGNGFPNIFAQQFVKNSGSLHTFASGSSLILSRFRMYGSLLEWGYHRS